VSNAPAVAAILAAAIERQTPIEVARWEDSSGESGRARSLAEPEVVAA